MAAAARRGAYVLPFTGTSAPRVTRFCGEARNAIVEATSPSFAHFEKSAFGIAFRFASVSMIEGTTAFTQIPSAATSSASATVREATTDLLAV